MAERSEDKKLPAVARLKKSTVEEIPLPPPGGRAVLWDVEIKGFGVRVASNGRRTYVLSYRMGGREAPKRVFTIGRHGSPWTTEQARRRAIELLGMVRQGVDPALERVRARDAVAEAAERRAARSFEKLADDWMKGHVRRSKLRSERDIEGVVERDLKPAFAGKSVDEITRADVTAALDAIGARSETAANKCHKWLRAMFNWFIDKGVVKSSPLDRMSRPFAEDSRTRSLSMLELVVMLTAGDDAVQEACRHRVRARDRAAGASLDVSSERGEPISLGAQHRRNGGHTLVDHVPQSPGRGRLIATRR